MDPLSFTQRMCREFFDFISLLAKAQADAEAFPRVANELHFRNAL